MSLVLNLDGLVGPSHNYGGLAVGNLASAHHKGEVSSPKQAALQGLEKMWALSQMGLAQGFIPPQPRPNLHLLRAAGFSGSTGQLIDQAFQRAPELLEACYSASSMWTANSATITAAVDSEEQRLQITPANLISALHRSQECQHNQRFFEYYFSDTKFFHVHSALPNQPTFADEGAANHIRLSDPSSDHSLNLFVFGHDAKAPMPTRFPARQTRLASESLIRRHKLKETHWLLIQQNPNAIDAGAFHNDVVAVGLDNFLLLHEAAFYNQPAILDEMRKRSSLWRQPLHIFQVTEKELPLTAAIQSYLFNSQLVTTVTGEMWMIAPKESQENPLSAAICERILEADNPINKIEFFDLRQSMNNGGGPACLRLALPITTEAIAAIKPGILLNESLYHALQHWINQHYRDQLTSNDLRDPQLIREIHVAMEALAKIAGAPLQSRLSTG